MYSKFDPTSQFGYLPTFELRSKVSTFILIKKLSRYNNHSHLLTGNPGGSSVNGNQLGSPEIRMRCREGT